LAYAKFEGDLFFFNWLMTFSPTLLYLALQMLRYLKRIIIIDEETIKDAHGITAKRFSLMDNLFHFILSLLMLCFVFYAIYRRDQMALNLSAGPLYVMGALYLFVQVFYTYSAKAAQNALLLPLAKDEEKKRSPLLTSILTPLFNFLGASFAVCGGGTCSSIYGSTISAIFSAFGISISEWMPYLDGVTVILVLVSVYVLYYAKKSFTYKPFILGTAAAVIILITQFFFTTRYPIYVGNVMMIAAALWNSKLNKAKMTGLFGKSSHMA